jgi:flagellar basal-body rod protein FlgG
MFLLGLTSASNGMQALIDQNDSTANNIANVNTVGFKRERLTFKDIYDTSVNQKVNNGSSDVRNIGSLSVGSQVQKLTYDFTQGVLSRTGNTFDLAIEGDGFFKVQSPKGETSYTRNGSFALDNKSFLVTKSGDYVLDTKNKRIRIQTEGMNLHSNKDILIGENGQIQIANEKNPIMLEQKVGIFDFANKEDMISKGDAKYVPAAGNNSKEMVPKKFIIQQGVLELSNANIVHEMINTINTSRCYESLAQIVKTDGDTLSQALRVGRLS